LKDILNCMKSSFRNKKKFSISVNSQNQYGFLIAREILLHTKSITYKCFPILERLREKFGPVVAESRHIPLITVLIITLRDGGGAQLVAPQSNALNFPGITMVTTSPLGKLPAHVSYSVYELTRFYPHLITTSRSISAFSPLSPHIASV
jgi:hypothetical protein